MTEQFTVFEAAWTIVILRNGDGFNIEILDGNDVRVHSAFVQSREEIADELYDWFRSQR